MKKLLLFLFLLPLFITAQPVRDEYFTIKGKPTIAASNTNAKSVDFVNKKVWHYTKLTNVWTEVTDTNIVKMYLGGGGGSVGPIGPQGPVGPQGIQGVPGVCPTCPPSGGGGASTPGTTVHNPYLIETLAEIQVGGTGSNQTIGTYTYSGITVTSADLLDWANLQYAMYLAKTKKKSVISVGNFNTAKSVELYKDLYNLNWDGGLQTTIRTQNNNTFAVIGRSKPVDNNEANVMISNSTYVMRGIIIKAQSNQIGLELISTYSSLLEQIRVFDAYTAIHLRFALNTQVTLADAGTCYNGFIADIGNWTGASNSNSQSNHSTFYQCHIYSGSTTGGNVGFGVYACSGVVIDECIVEGGKYKRCIDSDFKMSSVVKDITIRNTHFETVYGNSGAASGEAYIFLRGVGTAHISGIFSQYPGCLINASGSPAQLIVIITGVEWMVTPPDGKLIYNAGNVMYSFQYNNAEQFSNPNTIASFFTGTAIAKCNGFACGLNKYEIKGFGY